MEKWYLPANANGLLVVYMSMAVGHQGDDLRMRRGMMEKEYHVYDVLLRYITCLLVKKASCIFIYVPFFLIIYGLHIIIIIIINNLKITIILCIQFRMYLFSHKVMA